LLNRKYIIFSFATLLAIVLLAFLTRQDMQDIQAVLVYCNETLIELSKINKLILVAMIALLPAVGFPSTPLIFVASSYGIVYGFVLSLIGIILNSTITYFIGSRCLRKPILRLFANRYSRIIDISPKDYPKLVFLLRTIPGIALPIQNYILGAMQVPFRSFILIATGVQSVWILVFILMGRSIISQRVENVISAILLFVCVIIFRYKLTKMFSCIFTEK